jgi:hypothetical protein
VESEEEEVVEVAPTVKKVRKAEMEEMCRILEAASLERNIPEAGGMCQFRTELLRSEMRAARQTTEGFLKLREAPAQ